MALWVIWCDLSSSRVFHSFVIITTSERARVLMRGVLRCSDEPPEAEEDDADEAEERAKAEEREAAKERAQVT